MSEPNTPDTPEVLPTVCAADIAQLYDAFAHLPKPDPSEEHPTPVQPDPDAAPTGALPAALEFDGLHGRIICPIQAVLTDAFLAHPDIAAKVTGGVQTVKLNEQPDGSWQLYLQGDDIHSGALFTLEQSELNALLTRDNITLWGRPSEAEFAEQRAAQAAKDAEAEAAETKSAPDDFMAPPF